MDGSFSWCDSGGGHWGVHSLLATLPGVHHFFSRAQGERSDTRFSLSLNGAYDRKLVLRSRERVSDFLGVEAARAVYMRQCHGAGVHVVRAEDAGRGAFDYEDGLPRCDALVTNVRGVLLVAQGADCLPVLLCDPQRSVVAAVHAGWRGSVAGVVGAALRAMEREFGTCASHVYAVLGPCIGAGAFEVGADALASMREVFAAEVFSPHPVPGKAYVNLRLANRAQLLGAGVPARQIGDVDYCTYSLWPQFFSARWGDQGRQGGGIVLV